MFIFSNVNTFLFNAQRILKIKILLYNLKVCFSVSFELRIERVELGEGLNLMQHSI